LSDETVYVDATGKVVGRLASVIAKMLLEGKKVIVLNVEKAVITGKKSTVIQWYLRKLSLRSKVNPRRHGPFKPKTPDGIFRRIVRGMLPRKKTKGKEAYKRLRVFIGTPKKFKNVELIEVSEVSYRKNPYGYLTLEELARLLNWKPVRERILGG